VSDHVRVYIDPTCPWAWQTAKWMRAVTEVRDVAVEWRLFSLEISNAQDDADPLSETHRKSIPALRTLALVRREQGEAAMERLYESFGKLVHEQDARPSIETVRAALSDANLDPAFVDRALTDDATKEEVLADHEASVKEVDAFGVPTIVLPSGRGIFGPVVAIAPTGEAAGDLWDHASWLIDQDGFFELKRHRDRRPGEAP
jgi:predicted DsbA family dithiol-disulfide isomerase